jgi:FAD/FMN-containing dehydrogenase
MTAKTFDASLVHLDSTKLGRLHSEIHGKVITPQDAEYDEARSIWNSMIDRKPALIVQCSGTADVLKAVRFAKEHKLLISVKGAGHNIAGRALADNVLLIDLSKLRYVHVDPELKTATVSPGATLADVDAETQHYGLALPVGINSTTGIAGLTLGGGFGWLSRKFGLTIDNLLSLEVVTVDGTRLVCSKDKNSDLFWAMRGGGGNFGIATSFTFQLHALGPTVLAGPVVYSISEAKEVLRKYREFCRQAPQEVAAWAVMRNCPPFPFVNEAHHNKPALIIVGIYTGPLEEGKKLLEPLKQMGTPLGDALVPHQFCDFQKSFDPLLTPGVRNYWKTHTFTDLDDKLIDVLVEQATNLPSPYTEIFIGQLGGKINEVPIDATAYPHRTTEYIMNVHTRWEDKGEDSACKTWANALHQSTKPYATGGAYVNFVSAGDDSPDSSYKTNIDRLAQIKEKYDPNNVLRSTVNIK